VHERLSDDAPLGTEGFRAYGRCVPVERSADARAQLLAVDNTAERIAAVYAVCELADRGLDVAGLEPVLLAPVEVLERGHTGDDEDALLSRARYAIEYNRVTWSERAAAALERAGYTDEARKVRAGLQSPWKRG
jgi:hypothetical protein